MGGRAESQSLFFAEADDLSTASSLDLSAEHDDFLRYCRARGLDYKKGVLFASEAHEVHVEEADIGCGEG